MKKTSYVLISCTTFDLFWNEMISRYYCLNALKWRKVDKNGEKMGIFHDSRLFDHFFHIFRLGGGLREKVDFQKYTYKGICSFSCNNMHLGIFAECTHCNMYIRVRRHWLYKKWHKGKLSGKMGNWVFTHIGTTRTSYMLRVYKLHHVHPCKSRSSKT